MPRILSAPVHDPDELTDYTIDWSNRMETSETISTSTWSYTGSPDTTVLTLSNAATSGQTTTTWVSGGTEGTLYTLLNRIVTSGGRDLDQSVYVRCRAR